MQTKVRRGEDVGVRVFRDAAVHTRERHRPDAVPTFEGEADPGAKGKRVERGTYVCGIMTPSPRTVTFRIPEPLPYISPPHYVAFHLPEVK